MSDDTYSYEDRNYEWNVQHDVSPSGYDYGYNITRRIKRSGMSTSLNELSPAHLLALRDVLNEALRKILSGEL